MHGAGYPLGSSLTFLFVQKNYGQAYQGLKHNKTEEILLVKEPNGLSFNIMMFGLDEEETFWHVLIQQKLLLIVNLTAFI